MSQRYRTSLNLEERKERQGGRQHLVVNRHMRTKHGKLRWVEYRCVLYHIPDNVCIYCLCNHINEIVYTVCAHLYEVVGNLYYT